MTGRTERTPSAFRLNLEQQKNRAKKLLRAAKAADADALSRLAKVRRDSVAHHSRGGLVATVKLADAQLALARELRFASWAKLKAHIESMDRQRAAIDKKHPAPDGDLKTLHIRCGSDIQETLAGAGFAGDFLVHAIPYCLGPVTAGPVRHELMARFLADTFPGLVYEHELEGLRRGEQRLHRTADDYERVVLWMEHDSWDQLVLVRLLAHYADIKRPPVLELIVADEFPGSERYIGLGQLPPEALRLLWRSRKPVKPAQLMLGNDAWNALASDDPRPLAALARSGTPALPIMALALHRHLCELPSVENGLSLTEHLVLQVLAEGGTFTLNRVWELLQTEREPLPWIGDLGFLHVIEQMGKVSESVFIRNAAASGQRSFLDRLSITGLGRAVLCGERDWRSLRPPSRWVGGVHIQPTAGGWRWDEAKCDAVFRQ
jgi:hypothetical protein